MTRYEERVSLLEILYRKPGLTLSQMAATPEMLERLIREVFDDLQGANAQLREQVATLQARNKELDAYAHMVAHDLKDPLTVIVGTSDVITRVGDLTPQELKAWIRQIKSTAFDMNTIIDSLLLLAEVPEAEAPVEVVDMNTAVSNVLNRLIYLIEEHRARINCPKSWPAAIGYGPWIEEVWANYLTNALKHGGPSPSIELGASAVPDGMIRFWTQDKGPGLPPQAKSHLFTPVSQPHERPRAGHSLGLSIVQRIVKKLGGQVGVESELGQGCLFFFTLPAAASSPARLRHQRPSNLVLT